MKKKSKRAPRKRRKHDKVTPMLNSVMVWSNIFFIMASVVSFYGKHALFGWIFLCIGIISAIHHTNWNVGLGAWAWGKLDVLFAFGGSLAIVVYGIQYISQNKQLEIFQTRRTFMIGISTVVLFLVAIGTCIIAKAYSCRIRFLVYHSLWHVIGGIAGLFFSILITTC